MTDPIEGSAPVADVPSELSDTRPPNDRLPAVVPPIAGFWRRIAAFALDGLLLGVAAQALVWTMSPFWFRIGPYGRFVGALIALLYFGLMNSRVRDGQTVGKRMMGIAVRDRGNQAVGVGRSMARTLIWLIPWMLNGWGLPTLRTPLFSWFASAMIFGVGGAVVFTMVFNQRTRQGLHDMVCDTFVIHVDATERIAAFPSVARLQWIASGILLAVSMLLPAITTMFVSRYATTLAQLVRLHGVLESDPRFFSASVLDQTYSGSNGQSTHALQIDAWYKGNPPEDVRHQARKDIARSALATVADIEKYDQMRISVSSAYDLGIATGRVTQSDHHTIPEWRETVAAAPSRSTPSQ